MLQKAISFLLYLCLKTTNTILKQFNMILFKKFRNDTDLKNILIYRIGNIGDILCSLPAMNAIRKKYPNASITLLSNSGGATSAYSILKDISWINEIIMYDKDNYNTLNGLLSFIIGIKKRRYDCLINLPNVAGGVFTQLRNMIFFKLLGIPIVGNFYVHNLKFAPKLQIESIDRSNEVLRLVNNLPFKYKGELTFDFDFENKTKLLVQNKLKQKGIICSDQVLAISFSCKGDAKKWPLDRFAYIAKRWIEECKGVVFLIGALNDRNDARIIMNKVKNRKCYNMCGEFTIQESIFLMSQIKLLVGLDTGTSHMASVVGCRSITLFSSFDFPDIWNPYGDQSLVIRKDLDCSPCLCKDCKFGFPSRCMNAISKEEVWDMVIRIVEMDTIE